MALKESIFSIAEEFLPGELQRTVRWQEAIEQYLSAMLSSPTNDTGKAEQELLH